MPQLRDGSSGSLGSAGDDEGRSAATDFQGISEVFSMTSELQVADSAQVRSSAMGLRLTSDVLAVTLELQGAGSDEGRTTVTA